MPGKRGAAKVVFLILLLWAHNGSILAQDDISAFKITDVGGEFSIRYLLDDWQSGNPDGVSYVTNPSWYEELNLRARGYVYHPAFLDWTVDGGPLLVQHRYESDVGNNSGKETLFNFGAVLNFLNLRPYPFSLYLRRDHPEVVSGASGRFLTETNEYGIRGQFLAPLSPATIHWEVSHYDMVGSGLGTTLDENLNRALLTASMVIREFHNLRLELNWNDRLSKSGSPGLPIQESSIDTRTVELQEDSRFGENNQIQMRHNLRWFRQETTLDRTTELDILSYTGALNWKHNEATRSFTNLLYRDTDRTNSWSRVSRLSAGVNHDVFEGLLVSGDGEYSRNQAQGFSENVAGGRASANYKRPLSIGNLGISGSLRITRTDRQSDADRVTIFDEPVVLVGVVPVALSQDFVVTESVVVTNVPKTQTFVPGLDYLLNTVGSTTTIERVITGNIEDGQTVLVTYDVLTGGTVKFDTITQGLGLNLGLWRYANLFLNYNDTDNSIIDGFPTTPLNDVNRIEVGGRLDYPFNSGWTVGGEYRYTNQDEDIAPYVRNSFDIYTQTARYWNTSARFRIHHETVDNKFSVEDVDLYRYTLSLTSRLPGGVIVAYHAEYGEDTGGTILREDKRQSIRIDWGYRQVLFTLNADYSDVTQGESRRKNTRVTALLRRVF